MTSKSLPLFYNRTLLEQTGIEEYLNWDYIRFPHFAIFGSTGTGKTYGVKLIIGRISQFISSAKITVCDFKADPEDFGFLRSCPRYYTYMDCLTGLNNFYEEFLIRKQKNDTTKSFRLLMFDEWASFLLTLDKKAAEEAKHKLGILLMTGRSWNFHIGISQQRIDANYFSSGARDQFSIIYALGNISKESANMFGFELDQMQPVHQQGAGFMLTNSTDLVAFQIPRITNTAKLERYMIEALSR